MKVLIAIAVFCSLASCGKDETKIIERETQTRPVEPNPNPNPNPNPPAPQITFERTIRPLIDKHCALSGCHAGAGFFETEAQFLNSRSKIRVSNSTMPPQFSPVFAQWTQKEKSIFNDYFDSK